MQAKKDQRNMTGRIDRLKRELSCNQEELAAVLGVSKETLSLCKCGKRRWQEWLVLRVAFCEARLGLDPVKEEVATMPCTHTELLSMVRETVGRVEKMLKRQRRIMRAAI